MKLENISKITVSKDGEEIFVIEDDKYMLEKGYKIKIDSVWMDAETLKPKSCMTCSYQTLFDIDEGDCRECMQIEEDTGVEYSKWVNR